MDGMKDLPRDPMIFLSYVNTQLRDFYPSLEEFCQDKGVSAGEVSERLRQVDYLYDDKRNQFV